MSDKKILLLIDEILEKTTELKISEILPKALTLSMLINDKDFEK